MLLWPVQQRALVYQQLEVITAMMQLGLAPFFRRKQMFVGELAQRPEQRKARLKPVAAFTDPPQQRFFHQCGQRAQVGRRDLGGGSTGEAAAEIGQPS
ncbi:hypothetical protein HC891_24960 [Candidatus Gracilibacteria bacterium]|nr:hypothetical protein [Candidatus Gracilibacteria bacterium]